MENDFYLKKIQAVYKDDESPSEVEFEKGVTVLHGPSNCGKSTMVDIAYTAFTRNDLKGNSFKDLSSCSLLLQGHDSGDTIEIEARKKDVQGILNKFGFPEKVILLAENKELSLQNLAPLLFLNEMRMLYPNNLSPTYDTVATTRPLMRYMYDSSIPVLPYNERSERAKIKELQMEISNLQKNRDKIISELEGLGISDDFPLMNTMDNTIREVETEIAEAEEKLSTALDKKNSLLSTRSSLLDKKNEIDLLIANQHKLMEQYEADIFRLEFIAEGRDVLNEESEEKVNCPFCGTLMSPSDSGTDRESLKNELEHLSDKASRLDASLSDFQLNATKIQNQLDMVECEMIDIDKEIDEESIPRKKYLESIRKNLGSVVERQGRINALNELIEQIDTNLDTARNQLAAETEKEAKEKPIPPDSTQMEAEIDSMLKKILRESGFRYWEESCYNDETLDMSIKGMSKIGSGWIAYLKSVLFISIITVLRKNRDFQLPFTILDTPFIGLSNEPGSDEMKMKEGLLQYLNDHEEETGQIILVEKTENIPDLTRYDHIKDIHFGNDSKALRKGFRRGKGNNLFDQMDI